MESVHDATALSLLLRLATEALVASLTALLFGDAAELVAPWAVRVAKGYGSFPAAETRVPSDSLTDGDER